MGPPREAPLQVTVERVESSPPQDRAVVERVVGHALQVLAARVARAYPGLGHVRLDGLAVDVPVVPDALLDARGQATAAAALAESLFRGLQPRLARESGVLLVDPHYKGDFELPRGDKPKAPGALDRVKQLLGLGPKAVTFVRPEATAAFTAGNADFKAHMAALEARARDGTLTGGDVKQAGDLVAAHLDRNGVAYERQGLEFTITPQARGAQLNVMARALRRKLGVTIVYDLRSRYLSRANAVASFNSETKTLQIDTRSIVLAAPSPTALHEIHHGFLYDRIGRQRDSFLNLKMRSLDMSRAISSGEMYQTAMSNQELSTFAKQPRQIVGLHLREANAYTAAFKHDVEVYLYKLREVAKNGREASDKMIPALERFIASGEGPVRFGTDKAGDITVKFQDRGADLHHMVELQRGTKRLRKLAGATGSLEAQKEIARDLLAKLRVTRLVSEVFLVLVQALERELAKLREGLELLPEQQRVLKNLLAWPGYVLRVGDAEGVPQAAREAELERQKQLIQGLLAA